MSFGSPKGTLSLNPMRYHGVSIENTCYHQPPLIVTQSIGIYDHFRVSPKGQCLFLILVQVQYPHKVESPCSIVAWWIMTIDSLVSWFTVGPVQCASHSLVHLPWENHLNNQDKSSLQLRVVHYSLYWIAQIHEPIMENLYTYKEPMTCIFYVTPNAPKSYTM